MSQRTGLKQAFHTNRKGQDEQRNHATLRRIKRLRRLLDEKYFLHEVNASPKLDFGNNRCFAIMLDNISPTSWDQYPTIGRNGTFLSDRKALTDVLGELNGKRNVTLTSAQITKIEGEMGLEPGSLQDGFKIRKVTDLIDMAPSSPLEGNAYFLGPGNHLPGGGPELVVRSIPTTDNATVKTILDVEVLP